MREIMATVTKRGQVAIPAEVRRRLGLTSSGKVIFALEGDDVRLRPARFTLESVFGSVPPIPGTTTEDFERQIDEAMEDEVERHVRALGGE
jgi:AbrB family looped-hinge helix DNA binding protein